MFHAGGSERNLYFVLALMRAWTVVAVDRGMARASDRAVPILLSAHRLEKHFASRTLFDALTFAVNSGDRIGLIGPNGAGKSTLLRVLAGQSKADGGELSLARGLTVGFLEQTPEFPPDLSVREAIALGCRDPYDYEDIMLVEEILARLEMDGDLRLDALSGGWRKRAALARELARKPDLLLLDEPTNHLDVESIQWLEEFLAAAPFATVSVTHDRLFLQRVAERIFDLDPRLPNGLLVVEGTYADYLEAKEGELAAQAKREDSASNLLRRETAWLRRGAKARQTKQKARIERAGDLKDEVSDLRARNQTRVARIDFQEADRNPQKLIEAKGIAKSYGARAVFRDVDILIGPKTRLGLLGPNGAGKSTLIRVLLGEELPDRGVVKQADKFQAAYFQQHRDSLDPALSVMRSVCPVGDYVQLGGQPVYARSYLNRFLFKSEQMDMPVGKLSGGEQARLRIAQLMLRPANVLVLDEPTNDLDAATLDVLERQLREFNGAVILVTHDRYFLDQVANQILAFEWDADGRPCFERFADFAQWEEWTADRPRLAKKLRAALSAGLGAEAAGVAVEDVATAAPPPAKAKKVSYKDKLELDGMEAAIAAAEACAADLETRARNPAIVADAPKLAAAYSALALAKAEVDRLYARWAELEGR